jgi:sulfite exporter TauE/SafE
MLSVWQAVGGGLLAGALAAPHCAVMCGPLAAAACGAQLRARERAVRYQVGRLLGYALAGSIAGQLGEVLALPTLPIPLLPLSVASVLILLAWRLLRPRAGAKLVQISERPRRRILSAVMRLFPREPLVLGGMTALLPCGALAAALALAAATGSASLGTSVMAGFVLTSGAGVAASGWLVQRLLAVRQGPIARVCAGALVVAAVLVLWRPVTAWVQGPHSDTTSTRCH